MGAPALRRFSTECSSQSAMLAHQLVVLRQQQAQHIECAADGLVRHDVSAEDTEPIAGLPTSPGAGWGQCRPPRNRRLSNVSMLSSMSIISTSISNTEEEEDLELVEDLVPYSDSGQHDHQLVAHVVSTSSNCTGDKLPNSACAANSRPVGASCLRFEKQGPACKQPASAEAEQIPGEPAGPDMQLHQGCAAALHADVGTDSLSDVQQQMSSLQVSVVSRSGSDGLCLRDRQSETT